VTKEKEEAKIVEEGVLKDATDMHHERRYCPIEGYVKAKSAC
jgi:hypothetical protein